MSDKEESQKDWYQIMDLAQRYPSPHNGQPVKLKIINADEARLFFDTGRGLFASNLGYKFSYLSVGVFVEYFCQSARALGYEVNYDEQLSEIDINSPRYLHPFGKLKMLRRGLAKDEKLESLLRNRQTSRNNYLPEAIPQHVIDSMRQPLKGSDCDLYITQDLAKVRKILWLNQETLFHDLQTKHMRAELDHYLRYSKREAKKLRDGLSAKCLRMPGYLMYLAIKFPKLVTNKVSGYLFKSAYSRTMNRVTAIAWMQAPFKTHQEHLECGRQFMKVWIALTAQGYYLHPYGTIPTNDEIIKEFAGIVGAEGTDKKPIWMIFRLGKSKQPPWSYRLLIQDHFVGES